MAKTQILIVEDETVVAMDMEGILDSLGYDVAEIVSSGEEAVQKAEEIHPDLVLMDILLEGDMDGIEAAQQISERFNIPVVYLTAHSDEKTLQRAKLTGPYGYIIKPFGEVRATIEMALYKHKMEKKLKQWVVTTLRNVSDVVITTGKNGRLTFMNPSAEAMTGWNHWEALGKDLKEVLEIINEKKQKLTAAILKKVAQEAASFDLSSYTLLSIKDGKETSINGRVISIKDDEETITGIIWIFRNPTQWL